MKETYVWTGKNQGTYKNIEKLNGGILFLTKYRRFY